MDGPVTHVGLQVPGCYVGELISLCAVAAELSLTSAADLFQFSVFTTLSSFLAFFREATSARVVGLFSPVTRLG